MFFHCTTSMEFRQAARAEDLDGDWSIATSAKTAQASQIPGKWVFH